MILRSKHVGAILNVFNVKFYVSALVGVIMKVILQNARCNNKYFMIMFTPARSWYPAPNQQVSSPPQPRIHFNISVYINPVTYSVLNSSK